MIILKVTANQGFTRTLEDTFFETPHERSNCPPRPRATAFLGYFCSIFE